jgi:hypothetical protein
MFPFERVLVTPQPADLERAILQATEATNAKALGRKVRWSPEALAAAQALVGARGKGFRQWNGADGDARADVPCSGVAIAWWSDRLGRKHVRVVGLGPVSPKWQRRNGLTYLEAPPPLWLVYPQEVHLCERDNGWALSAVCACGAAGAPEALGWTGPCCGPCHDRREMGEDIPLLPGRPTCTRARLGTHCLECGAFSPDGRHLYTIRGEVIRAWDLRTAAEDTWALSARARCLAVSPDGERLAISTWDGRLTLADVASHAPLWRTGPEEAAEVAFSPDGEHLAVLPYRGVGPAQLRPVTLRDVETGAAAPALATRALLGYVAFAPDGRRLVLGGSDGVALWEVGAAEPRWLPVRGKALVRQGMRLSPDGKALVTHFEGGPVLLWDLESATSRPVLDKARGMRTPVQFTPDGRFLVSFENPGVLRFWDVAANREHVVYRIPFFGELSLLVGPGDWLATSDREGTVTLLPWPLLVGAN